MRVMVVYDSVYGNTERIAQAIGGAAGGDTEVMKAGQVDPSRLDSVGVLIVGASLSPPACGR